MVFDFPGVIPESNGLLSHPRRDFGPIGLVVAPRGVVSESSGLAAEREASEDFPPERCMVQLVYHWNISLFPIYSAYINQPIKRDVIRMRQQFLQVPS